MIGRVISSSRFALLRFRRNPASTFFTVVFPLLFLVLLGTTFGRDIDADGVRVATRLVPGILALSLVSATFVNLGMNTVIRREQGQLKRLRGTPLPPLVYIAGQILAAFVVVLGMALLIVIIGHAALDAPFQWRSIGIFVVTVLLGTATFSALGLAITSFIPNADAASPLINAAVFPLYFVSDVFFASDNAPAGLRRLADAFPVKPLAESFQVSFDASAESFDVPGAKWAVLAAWAAIGVAVTVRKFRWTAQAER